MSCCTALDPAWKSHVQALPFSSGKVIYLRQCWACRETAMLLDSSGLDSPACLMTPLSFMTGFEYGCKSSTKKGVSSRKSVSLSHRPQPLFRVGPVEDTFSNRRAAGGPICRVQSGEDARAHQQEEDARTHPHEEVARMHPQGGAKTHRENSSRGSSCRKQERGVLRYACSANMEQADTDGGSPSPRSTLDRLDSPPPSPPWALDSHEDSEAAGVSGPMFGVPAVDLPAPPPPIHTVPPALKKSPYSAELRTEYAPFKPEPEVKPGLGDRCKSYSSLSALAGTPTKGLRRSKSSVDCRLRPPLPRPGIQRVASVIDSYTPKTLEQFLETEDNQDCDFEESFPEELCTPDMMTQSLSSPAARSHLKRQSSGARTHSCARLVLRVNNQVPSILDSEDMTVPV
eukprot:jgi/Botrbrau1/15929/Bobra.0253s0004.1